MNYCAKTMDCAADVIEQLSTMQVSSDLENIIKNSISIRQCAALPLIKHIYTSEWRTL